MNNKSHDLSVVDETNLLYNYLIADHHNSHTHFERVWRYEYMSRFTEHIKTLIKLDTFALGIMHLSNSFINSIAAGKNMLKPGGGKYYTWKHGEVFYHRYGAGDPLVLIHDLHPAFSSYEWNEVVDALSMDHTVYTIDLPGCGRSSKKKMTYTNYFYELFLTSFIKDIVKKKCTVIASGYSSSFAITTAVHDESLIDRIVAVNPKSLNALMRTPTRRSSAASILIALPVIGTSVYNMSQSRSNIDYAFTEKYMYNPFRSKNRFTDAFYEGAHFNEGKGKYLLASIQGNTMTVDLSKALRKVGEKLCIIYGEKAENAEMIASVYQKEDPSLKIQAVPSAGMLPQMENPSEFIAAFNSLG